MSCFTNVDLYIIVNMLVPSANLHVLFVFRQPQGVFEAMQSTDCEA